MSFFLCLMLYYPPPKIWKNMNFEKIWPFIYWKLNGATSMNWNTNYIFVVKSTLWAIANLWSIFIQVYLRKLWNICPTNKTILSNNRLQKKTTNQETKNLYFSRNWVMQTFPGEYDFLCKRRISNFWRKTSFRWLKRTDFTK